MATVILGTSCKQCGRYVPNTEAKTTGDEDRGYLCEQCVFNNTVAYDALVQHIAAGYASDVGQRCQGCNKTLDEIQFLTGHRKMYLHIKDNIKQLLCRFCSDEYEKKATNLYRGTWYGWLKKLDGNK